MTAPPRSTSAVDTEPIAVPHGPAGRVDTLEIPVSPPPASVPAPPSASAPRRRGPGAGTVAGVAFLAAAAGALAGGLALGGLGQGGLDLAGLNLGGADAGQSAEAEPGVVLEPASVTSVDPSGGSGFQAGDGGGWRTQTYTTSQFGNLKEGVGLLVDLGAAQEVGAVSLTGATSGLAVELRAADGPAGDVDAFAVADTARTDGAETVLDASDAEAARYWLVWVSELAPSGSGFAAEIGDLELRSGGR